MKEDFAMLEKRIALRQRVIALEQKIIENKQKILSLKISSINKLHPLDLFKMLGGLKLQELKNPHLFEALCNRPDMEMVYLRTFTTKDKVNMLHGLKSQNLLGNQSKRISHQPEPFITSDNQKHWKIPKILADLLSERKGVNREGATWEENERMRKQMDEKREK